MRAAPLSLPAGSRITRLAAMAILVLPLAACGTEGDSRSGATGSTADDTTLEGGVTVLAAASLTDAFEELASSFEAANPGVRVELSFGASSALATQVVEGAPADVFASADQANIDTVVEADAARGTPQVFATNELEIVVEKGNPLGITGLEDLTGGLRLALCAPEVACGRYAAQAFQKAGLDMPAASAEENVKGVLTKVALGEADAGIVYMTDVAANADVDGVALDADHQVLASYPVVVLRDASNAPVATAFVAYLLGPDGAAILKAYGFGPP